MRDNCPVCGSTQTVSRGGKVWCQECGYRLKEAEPTDELRGFY